MIRDSLLRVLAEYPSAKAEQFGGHALAAFLRHDLPNYLKGLVGGSRAYRFDGSAGKGQWTDCPWVATFDILVTESAQSGFYPVYLFREDMAGVFLSLNQGITKLKEQYGTEAKRVLEATANQLRATISPVPQRLSLSSIDLAVKSPSDNAAFYEAGNICARYYRATDLPSEEELVADYREMLRLYALVRHNKDAERAASEIEQDEGDEGTELEDLTRMKLHKRIERRASLARKAKAIHGYDCRACGFNFYRVYRALGKDFIEAHHLVPLHELKGQVVRLDPRTDFTVLCSNCHSMIHRFEQPGNIDAFKKTLSNM